MGARAPGHESEQARGAAGVQTPDLQALRSGPQFHVVSPPQLGSSNIYQAMPQEVGAQQQLAFATFKAAKVKAINTQQCTSLVQPGELSRGDEQPSGPHPSDQADDQRIASGPQPDHHILQWSYPLTSASQERQPQQLR